MNFFEQQDRARTLAGRLVVIFGAAIVGLTVSVYALGLAVMWAASGGTFDNPEEVIVNNDDRAGGPVHGVPSDNGSGWPWWWQPEIFFITMCVITGSVGVGSWLKTNELRSGGASVAFSLGGRIVDPATDNRHERRLLNVVEEMAIASGVPVPQVFVLDDEPSINAFAAGWSQDDAAVAVTRGTLDVLDRDELQGVIAHEFSHILNGDMRLNIRLVGLLHGIQVLGSTGRFLVRSVLGVGSDRRHRGWTSSSNSRPAGTAVPLLALAGIALWLIGSIGGFFGRLIQLAVSRQREFLADASAVQFTRNPSGLARALRKIGGLDAGSLVGAHGADELAHLFFGQAISSWFDALATHPPLAERIRRLDPNFPGTFPPVKAPTPVPPASEATRAFVAESEVKMAAIPVTSPAYTPADTLEERSLIPLRATEAVERVGTVQPEHVVFGRELLAHVPGPARDATRHPLSAIAMVYALLLDRDDDKAAEAQLDVMHEWTDARIHREVIRLATMARRIDPAARLPLIELAMPSLRQLSPEQVERLRTEMRAVAEADDRLELAEYAIIKSIDNGLRGTSAGPRTIQFAAMGPLLGDASVLLTAVARAGATSPSEALVAFDAGRIRFGSRWSAELHLVGERTCTFGAVERALDRLGVASPAIQRRMIDAATHAILLDDQITVTEAELLRTFADALSCPLPPFLPVKDPTTTTDAATPAT